MVVKTQAVCIEDNSVRTYLLHLRSTIHRYRSIVREDQTRLRLVFLIQHLTVNKTTVLPLLVLRLLSDTTTHLFQMSTSNRAKELAELKLLLSESKDKQELQEIGQRLLQEVSALEAFVQSIKDSLAGLRGQMKIQEQERARDHSGESTRMMRMGAK